MRQNYGTDWLLSTSNLIEGAQSSIANETGREKSKIENNCGGGSGGVEKILESNQDRQKADDLSELIIESFAVYRSIEFSVLDLNSHEQRDQRNGSAASNHYDDDDDENSTKTICILSVGEKCLIEKDETNSSVLCLNELVNLSDIKLSTESK